MLVTDKLAGMADRIIRMCPGASQEAIDTGRFRLRRSCGRRVLLYERRRRFGWRRILSAHELDPRELSFRVADLPLIPQALQEIEGFLADRKQAASEVGRIEGEMIDTLIEL